MIRFVNQTNWRQLFGQFPAYQVTLIQDMNDLLPPAGICTRDRLCHFLAQTAHETGGFKYDEELASGREYEHRSDLGNTQPGDGVKFKGRGFIQLTGRSNYKKYGELLNLPLEQNPELAKQSRVALKVALVYWNMNDLNFYADRGDFEEITRRINGGLNGLADRWAWLNKIMTAYDSWRKQNA